MTCLVLAWRRVSNDYIVLLNVQNFAPEEVGHAYGPAWNYVSRMVSKHWKINVEMALKM